MNILLTRRQQGIQASNFQHLRDGLKLLKALFSQRGVMDDEFGSTVQEDPTERNYSLVPADFPRPEIPGAVSGFQPKLLLSQHSGRFYATGCSPPELYRRWDRCEDLANQLATKSFASKQGKRSHMTELAILEQYLPRLIATRWTTEAEARFIIRRTAQLLGWPVPPAASP